MPLTDQEMIALEIIARYNFLSACQSKELITEENYDKIVLGFSTKNHEIVDYYLERVDDYVKDTPRHLEELKETD